MKINNKTLKTFWVNLSLSGFLVLAIGFSPTQTAAQTKLVKTINAYIEKNREDASEYKQARKIVYGDVDGDGTNDAVVQYTLEGAGGGNSWGQQLVVFLNKKGVYSAAADETVGGKFFRSFKLMKVVGKEIIGATETCPEDEPQGMCKNPAKGQIKFVLANDKLVEK